jgi:hypothetical protein
MLGRFQPTETGFILEGEVQRAAPSDGSTYSVSGAELDPHWNAAERSLLDVLRQFEGRKVRITLDVVEHRPVDTLRELLERYKKEAEADDDAFSWQPSNDDAA